MSQDNGIKFGFTVKYHPYTAKRKPFFSVVHPIYGRSTFRLSTFTSSANDFSARYGEAFARYCAKHSVSGRFQAGKTTDNVSVFVYVDSAYTVTI